MIEGYEQACRKVLEILPDCVCSSAKNLHDVKEATSLIRTAVMSKQYGNEDFLANLIAQACGESVICTIYSTLSLLKMMHVFMLSHFLHWFMQQFPSSQSLAILMLITLEFARFW